MNIKVKMTEQQLYELRYFLRATSEDNRSQALLNEINSRGGEFMEMGLAFLSSDKREKILIATCFGVTAFIPMFDQPVYDHAKKEAELVAAWFSAAKNVSERFCDS